MATMSLHCVGTYPILQSLRLIPLPFELKSRVILGRGRIPIASKAHCSATADIAFFQNEEKQVVSHGRPEDIIFSSSEQIYRETTPDFDSVASRQKRRAAICFPSLFQSATFKCGGHLVYFMRRRAGYDI